jgi:hypothetical protein
MSRTQSEAIALVGRAPRNMTHEQAVAHLVELEVARWGEQEREPARQMYGRYSHGLALNRSHELFRLGRQLVVDVVAVVVGDDADLHVLAQGG